MDISSDSHDNEDFLASDISDSFDFEDIGKFTIKQYRGIFFYLLNVVYRINR